MSERQKRKGVTGNSAFRTILIGVIALPALYLATRAVAPRLIYDSWLMVRSPESLVQASRFIGECRNSWTRNYLFRSKGVEVINYSDTVLSDDRFGSGFDDPGFVEGIVMSARRDVGRLFTNVISPTSVPVATQEQQNERDLAGTILVQENLVRLGIKRRAFYDGSRVQALIEQYEIPPGPATERIFDLASIISEEDLEIYARRKGKEASISGQKYREQQIIAERERLRTEAKMERFQASYERKQLRAIAAMEGLQERIEQRLDKQMLGSARSVIADVSRAYEEGFAGEFHLGTYSARDACNALGRKSPYDVEYR